MIETAEINMYVKFNYLTFQDNVSLAAACVNGCHHSPGMMARTDGFNVNLDCENHCKSFSSDDLRSACYTGCTYIPTATVTDKTSPDSIFKFISGFVVELRINFLLLVCCLVEKMTYLN